MSNAIAAGKSATGTAARPAATRVTPAAAKRTRASIQVAKTAKAAKLAKPAKPTKGTAAKTPARMARAAAQAVVQAPVKKAATKAATKVVTKAVTKASATKAPVKRAGKTPAAVAKSSAPVASVKPAKVKLMRDSFTMPSDEYAALATLKQRALQGAHPVKKSELLRAGIKLLAGLSDAALLQALKNVPAIKTGRPKAKKGE